MFINFSEPSVRSTLASMTVFAYTFGFFIVMGLGAVFSWRQVSLICAVVPVCCLIAVLFVIIFIDSTKEEIN